MARFSEPGLRLGEAEISWRQKRRRTNYQAVRDEFAEEEENIHRSYEQEFEAEEVHNEEFGEDGNLGLHGDYGEDSEDHYEEEENDAEEFHGYNGEDEDGALPQEEDNEEIQENYAEEENHDERQEEHNQERREDEHKERRDAAGDNNDNASVSVTLIDPDVLDCPICYMPLIIPIFQCGNGHVACPSCCTKLNNLCASCRYPIDYRSRAMERVLESAQVKCKNTKYGCKETMNYSKKQEHEKTCLYEPCSCPISDCNFVGSSCQLYQHFDIKHRNSAIGFSYNSHFHITAKADGKSFILQEEKDKVLFIVNNHLAEGVANVLTVNCIASKSDELMLAYRIHARDSSRLHCLQFQSITTICQNLDDTYPPTRYLLVPWHFLSHSRHIELDICIWRPSAACVQNVEPQTNSREEIDEQEVRENDGVEEFEEQEDTEEDEEENDKGRSVTLSDPEVLDCPFCCKPLTIPVFQCENGHVSCSFCFTKLMSKCPSCRSRIGFIRNHAIEKVLESAKETCRNRKHGCKEMICYGKQYDHGKRCHHGHGSCPLSDCCFVGSSRQLYKHFSVRHKDSAIPFQCNISCFVKLNNNDKFVVLREVNSSVLFILNNVVELLGNIISICCIAPASLGLHLAYDILATEFRDVSGGSAIKFQSSTRSVQNLHQISPLGSFLLVPCAFIG